MAETMKQCLCAAAVLLFSAPFSARGGDEADLLKKYSDDIRGGPAVYYTPEAAAYFATLGTYSVSGISVDKEAAVRSFVAATKLGGMPLAVARDAVSLLIDIFPRAIHVVRIQQARYAGEGTFEDCVNTYVMSAKNQFILACPFLDYNSFSLCENFVASDYTTDIIDKQANKKGVIREALFNVRITFTYYAGECALSRLTGMSLGHEQAAWRSWWLTAQATPPVVPAPVPVAPAEPSSYVVTGPNTIAIVKNTYSDIAVGGKYRVFLNTGDDLTGTVESRDDTSLVLETTDGKPYAFKFTLMQSYQVIEPPKPKPAPPPPPVVVPPEDNRPKGPFDTLWIKNPETDNYGRPLPDHLYAGVIVDEGDNFVAMKSTQGASLRFNRDEISRFVRNSSDNSDASVRRYAKPLTCPPDMVLVDMPPGRGGKPFFKVCIDRYEYPDRAGTVPRSNISYEDAVKFCEQQGKRICTAVEWSWTCGGLDGLAYPYGKTFDQERCNADTRMIEASGSRINCTSQFGVFDMTGNVFEWVTNYGKPALMGGPFSKCQTVSPSASGNATPQSGVRCCKGN